MPGHFTTQRTKALARLSRPRPALTAIAAAIVIRVILIVASSVGAEPANASGTPANFHIDYSATPDSDALLAFDVSILNPSAEIDLAPGQALGNRFFAYISVVEVASDATYRDEAEALGVKFPSENPLWKSQVADLGDPRWRKFVLEHLASDAAVKGYDGFFLDTIDSLALLEKSDPAQAPSFREGAIQLIRELRELFPDKQIIVNRGFDLLEDIRDSIDGVLIESVLHSYDFAAQKYTDVSAAQTDALRTQINRIRSFGLPVYAVDYLPADATDKASAAARKLLDLGTIPLITHPQLTGTPTAWSHRVARRILVLHGHDSQFNEEPVIWPADTTSHSILQTALEWMGYEVEYHDVSHGLPAPRRGTGSAWAGVIVDDEIDIPTALEEPLVHWLLERRAQGQKLLFIGDYPFTDEIVRRQLFDELGMTASEGDNAVLRLDAVLSNPRFTVTDPAVMNFEIDARPSLREFQNIQAPDGAHVLLSVAADTATGSSRHFDAVYTTSWGGCMLAPYVVFEASEETVLSYADPFAFLGEIWPEGKFPAPDPSTRDGLRAFYTHIDGDGFSSRTSVEEGRMCGEFLYDRLLRDLPFPVTVSVVEAEMRAHMLTQDPSEEERCKTAARRIFELPQVEPASHSYSHPYVWFAGDDAYSGLYGSDNLDLKLTARYPDVVTEREIAGSIGYIDQHLTPKDKPTAIMLWSGNCRPGVESLEIVARLGIEAMNGGNTILSRRFPGISAVAPRISYWEDQLQVYASNQNEFIYTNGWNGPYYGGFRQVIETFEMTEGKRRLKPVNVYYHFYSVERPDALKALEDIYDWCRKQPLHSVTAAQFAALTRDSHHTEIHQTGPRQWTAINNGDLRTYRFPKELGVPDLNNCRGVTGYTSHHDSWYLHTDGKRKTVIALADRPQQRLHLQSSSAEIEFGKLDAKLATFEVHDFRAVTVVLAGIEIGRRAIIDVNGKSHHSTADESGKLTLQLPASAAVRVALLD